MKLNSFLKKRVFMKSVSSSAWRNLALSALVACSFACFPMTHSNAAPEAISVEAQVGTKAPDFTLNDIDGKTVKLSDFHKKLVVLEWFNDGGPFVKRHHRSDAARTRVPPCRL
jgi:hypothetical protein